MAAGGSKTESAPNEIAHLNSASSIASGLAVDAEKNTLMLETRDGVKQVPVAIAATIRGAHGEVLTFGDLKPGDAVAYTTVSEIATNRRQAILGGTQRTVSANEIRSPQGGVRPMRKPARLTLLALLMGLVVRALGSQVLYA